MHPHTKKMKNLTDDFMKKFSRYMETGKKADGVATRDSLSEIQSFCAVVRKYTLSIAKELRRSRMGETSITPEEIDKIKNADKDESTTVNIEFTQNNTPPEEDIAENENVDELTEDVSAAKIDDTPKLQDSTTPKEEIVELPKPIEEKKNKAIPLTEFKLF